MAHLKSQILRVLSAFFAIEASSSQISNLKFVILWSPRRAERLSACIFEYYCKRMETKLIKDIQTEKGDKVFQVRLLKQEGVGLLTTHNEDNYLILDSLDYWYDLIQTTYPSKKKCTCKNEWFTVQYIYTRRAETEDIRSVVVVITCTACRKSSQALSIDVDYSPTTHLVEAPIVFCGKPKIKYKFSELTCYWQSEDLKDFLQFMFNKLPVKVYCWFFKLPEKKRYFELVSYEKAVEIITVNHRYLDFYFSLEELDVEKYLNRNVNADEGVYLKLDIWRKNEFIRLSSPSHILGYGLLYYVNFCNQYLDKEVVKDKSPDFNKLTAMMIEWMKSRYTSRRGKNSFDGIQAYEELIEAKAKRG